MYNPYSGFDSFNKEQDNLSVSPLGDKESKTKEETTKESEGVSLPWNAGFSFNYSENHNNPENIIRNITGSLRFSSDITKNWNVSYSTNFDFDRKVVTHGSINIRRDLHCWDGTLSWTVIGAGKGYYLRIGIKSPQLKDIKVEKQKGRSTFGGF